MFHTPPHRHPHRPGPEGRVRARVLDFDLAATLMASSDRLETAMHHALVGLPAGPGKKVL